MSGLQAVCIGVLLFCIMAVIGNGTDKIADAIEKHSTCQVTK